MTVVSTALGLRRPPTPLPGDLVFFGTSASTITHVGIALSSTEMNNAPDVGLPVEVDRISGHLVGITRPAA
ncbi:NlpC/P60 family protein [Kutzneria buriramensis]